MVLACTERDGLVETVEVELVGGMRPALAVTGGYLFLAFSLLDLASS